MHLRANLYALLAAVCWGGSFVSIRVLLRSLRGEELFACRFLPSGVLMLLVWLVLRRPSEASLRGWRTWGWLLLAGALAGPLYHLPLYRGGAGLGAGMLSILIATTPVQALLIELVLRWRRPTLPYVGGIFLAAAGAAVLVLGNRGDGDAFAVGGWQYPLWVLLAAFAGACFSIVGRKMGPRLGTLRLACLSIPLGVLLVPWLWPRTAALSRLEGWQPWTALAYLILAATVGATILWIKALRDLSPSQVTIYLYVTTTISSFLGWLLLDEQLGWPFFLAAACILGGLWLVNRPRPVAAAG